jgi:hypothetical protein
MVNMRPLRLIPSAGPQPRQLNPGNATHRWESRLRARSTSPHPAIGFGGQAGLSSPAQAGHNGDAPAIAQAAGEAGKALAAGNLDVALAARDLATQGRRAVKAAASGRRAPATRPGALRDLVEEHLRKFPDAAFTPHQVPGRCEESKRTLTRPSLRGGRSETSIRSENQSGQRAVSGPFRDRERSVTGFR